MSFDLFVGKETQAIVNAYRIQLYFKTVLNENLNSLTVLSILLSSLVFFVENFILIWKMDAMQYMTTRGKYNAMSLWRTSFP